MLDISGHKGERENWAEGGVILTDLDGDGFLADENIVTQACDLPDGFIGDGSDYDDTDRDVKSSVMIRTMSVMVMSMMVGAPEKRVNFFSP